MALDAPSKLPHVGTTIFTVMSQLAAECGAINLSQGFPDFDPPDGLLELLDRHAKAGHNQYSPMPGIPSLREQIAQLVRRSYGRPVDPAQEITVTTGATEALFAAIQGFARAEDEVIVLDPAYDSYAPAIELAGARAVHVPLVGADFHVDWARVEAAVTPATRMLIVNSPHNPTGAVFSAADLDALNRLAQRHDLLVLSDEVYEFMVFDGAVHQSVLRHPELASRALVVSSFGKTFHATGWKVGYVVAPAALTAEFRKVHQFVNFCTMTPAQFVYADLRHRFSE